MRLQSVILPDEKQNEELYYRGKLALCAGGALSFDTYYNCFCYTKYRKYTNVHNVRFSCKLNGRAMVRLRLFDGTEQILARSEGEGEISLNVDFSRLPENGFIYPEVIALSKCVFAEGGYYADDFTTPGISCCIAICTYKRESCLIQNLNILKDFNFSFIKRIFVVDNGNTLDVKTLSDNLVIVLPNKNYGGSGGFARGLIEAYSGGYSYVILMDDDIKFYPDILERMTVFAALLKPEYRFAHFGTAMISDNTPYIQYELGGSMWDGRRVRFVKHNTDMRTKKAVLDNLNSNEINYGAWWCFMMPVSDVEKYKLPYPFFIKMDDVEYGLRTCGSSPIITMNGIAVRHDDFDNKYSMHLEYYNVRNQLVLNAAHDLHPTSNALYRLFAVSFKHMALYRYDNMPIIFKAYNDYLCGVDFFLKCDEEKLNSELLNSAPKLALLADIPQWTEEMRSAVRHRDNKVITPLAVLTMAGHLIPAFCLKREISAAPLSKASVDDTLFRKTVIQYQYKGDTGIITKRSFVKFVKYGFLTLLMAVKVIFLNPKAVASYSKRKNEITSMEFWKKHLGLGLSD